MNLLAVLENMWHPELAAAGKPAPITFSINPYNYTGKKLYRITAGHRLMVTNAYSAVGMTAKQKVQRCTETDQARLWRALESERWDGVLVCGAPAKAAFRALQARVPTFPFFYILMPHPASRSLTNALLDGVKDHLNKPPVSCAWFRELGGRTYAKHYITP